MSPVRKARPLNAIVLSCARSEMACSIEYPPPRPAWRPSDGRPSPTRRAGGWAPARSPPPGARSLAASLAPPAGRSGGGSSRPIVSGSKPASRIASCRPGPFRSPADRKASLIARASWAVSDEAPYRDRMALTWAFCSADRDVPAPWRSSWARPRPASTPARISRTNVSLLIEAPPSRRDDRPGVSAVDTEPKTPAASTGASDTSGPPEASVALAPWPPAPANEARDTPTPAPPAPCRWTLPRPIPSPDPERTEVDLMREAGEKRLEQYARGFRRKWPAVKSGEFESPGRPRTRLLRSSGSARDPEPAREEGRSPPSGRRPGANAARACPLVRTLASLGAGRPRSQPTREATAATPSRTR